MPRSLGELTSSFPARVFGSILLLAAFAGVMSQFLARSESRIRPQPVAEQGADSDRRRCEEELHGILHGMGPGRLGISSDRVTLINELIRWDSNCGLSQSDAGKLIADDDVIRALLSGETLDRTLSPRFLPEDASHVRESLLARALVESQIQDHRSEIDRILSLFDFVVRYITLVPEASSADAPLTPYEALLFGSGSAADRANAFAALLRQMQIDAVILAPRSAPDNWLVGVLHPEEGVLVFDCRLGLPVPSPRDPGDAPFPKLAATLAEVRASDDVFRALDAPGADYPLRSADFDALQVRLIGNSSAWAPRMAELQYLLPSGIDVELYDGLGPNELRSPGLLDRVVAAGAGLWTADEVDVWPYPEEQLMRIEAARGAEGTILADKFRVFQGPYVMHVNPETKEAENSVPYSLHAVRVQQLMGRHGEALKNLLPIRNAVSASDRAENRATAEYATLWTGVSQIEQGQYRAAFSTFARYGAAYPVESATNRFAAESAALCLVRNKQFAEAATLLEQVGDKAAPQRNAWLIRRWRQLAAPDLTAPVETAPDQVSPPESVPTAPTPETPAAAAPSPESDSPSSPEADSPPPATSAAPSQDS